MTKTLYDADFYSWTAQQAALIRNGRLHEADLEHLAEEIETLGRLEAASLRSSYRLIAMHLLKMLHQPQKASASWENTVNRERLNAQATLADNPGLKTKRWELFAAAYGAARKEAAFETALPLERFPLDPPFSLDDIEAEGFWPPGFPKSRSL